MLHRTSVAILFLIILVFAYFLLQSPTVIWFNEHMTRDVARAYEWLELRPSSWWGAEMGWESNKRLPGPFFTWLLAFGGLFTGSVTGMVVIKSILSLASLLYLTWVIYRRFSLYPTLVFAAFFLSSPLVITVMRNLWNPSFLIPILALHYALMLSQPQGSWRTFVPWANGVLIALSVQVHFSALFPLLISCSIFYLFEKNWKALLISVVPVTALLALWSFSSSEQGFVAQTQGQYVMRWDHQWWTTRLQEARYHFFPSHEKIHNYDLFSFLSHISRHFLHGSIDQVIAVHRALSFIYWPVTLSCVSFLSYRATQSKDLLRPVMLIFWILLAIFTYIHVSYNVGSHVPYRYGLMLYPLQFLLWPMTLSELLKLEAPLAKVLSGILIGLSLALFTINTLWLIDFDRTMKLSGRSHQGPDDSMTVTLQSKLLVLEKLRSENPHTQDLWRCLHGKLAQRMRQDDMTWNQVTRWRALERDFPPKAPVIQTCSSHWFIADGYGAPEVFRWLKLTPEAFPSEVTLKSFQGKTVLNDLKLAHDHILPGLEAHSQAEKVELVFTIKRAPSLYLLIDLAQPQYIFTEPVLEIEGKRVDLPCLTRRTEFLVSSDCSVSLENYKGTELKGKLYLKLNQRPPHYSRLELLGMKELLREGY